MVLLENVEELDRSEGDATRVIELLRQWGYTARAIHVQARDFGSFPTRLRIYFLAVLSGDAGGLGFRSFLETLQVMRIDPFPLDRFLIGGEVFQTTQEPGEDSETPQAKQRRVIQTPQEPDAGLDPPPPAKKRRTENSSFSDEHCKDFRDFGQEWPIDKRTVEPRLACAVRGTTDRMAELIIFCNRQWPFRNDNPMLEPQFLDANLSIGFTLAPRAAGVTNPWKTVLGCITGGSKVFMRKCRDHDPESMEYMFLTGVELMQLVGWHRALFCNEVDLLSMETQGLLTSFAGNAFSGFAAIACLIDLFATFGVLEKGLVQRTCGSHAVDGQGDSQQSASEAAEPLGRLPTDEL